MAKSPKPPANFEEAIAKLEQCIRDIESGELSLDASLAAYRQGNELMRFCQQKLADVEQELKVLSHDSLKPLESSND